MKNCPEPIKPCPRCTESHQDAPYCRSCRLGLILQCVNIEKFYQRSYNKGSKPTEQSQAVIILPAGQALQPPTLSSGIAMPREHAQDSLMSLASEAQSLLISQMLHVDDQPAQLKPKEDKEDKDDKTAD